MRWRIGGAVLTVLALTVATCGVWMWLLKGSETTAQTYQRAPARLDFDFNDADLMIEPGPPGQVRVERELTWSVDKPRIKEEWAGDTLRVTITCRARFGSGCAALYRIQVPAATPVTARVGGGEVKIQDLTGALNVRTGSGDIKLRNTVGDLDLNSGSGGIKVTGAKSPRIDSVSGAGNVDLGFALAPASVKVRSGAGNIEILVPPGENYALAERSGAGNSDIRIGEDPASARRISCEAGAGNITVAYGTG